jgi:hypothetical protein
MSITAGHGYFARAGQNRNLNPQNETDSLPFLMEVFVKSRNCREQKISNILSFHESGELKIGILAIKG